MTSKDALNNIKNILREDENIWEYNEYIEQIEKDLEVLEILKSNVVSLNMITIFETCEGYNDWSREYHRYGYLLTKEDFVKVKEWIESGK